MEVDGGISSKRKAFDLSLDGNTLLKAVNHKALQTHTIVASNLAFHWKTDVPFGSDIKKATTELLLFTCKGCSTHGVPNESYCAEVAS